GFQHCRMVEQRLLHFGGGNIVTAAYDEVVVTALMPEVTVSILDEQVAGNVPAIVYILFLPFGFPPVATPCRASNGQEPWRAAWQVSQVFIDDSRFIAGNNQPRCTGTHAARSRGNKIVKEFGRTNTFNDLDSCTFFPLVVYRGSERLTSGNAEAQ